jgi:hypothetical protein
VTELINLEGIELVKGCIVDIIVDVLFDINDEMKEKG